LLTLVGVVVHVAGARWIDLVMPPAVTGTIVALIGLNLAPAAWDNVQKAPATAMITLGAIILITVLFKGLLGRLAILLGVLVGYVAAIVQHQVDFTRVQQADWVDCRTSPAPRSTSPCWACSCRWCWC